MNESDRAYPQPWTADSLASCTSTWPGSLIIKLTLRMNVPRRAPKKLESVEKSAVKPDAADSSVGYYVLVGDIYAASGTL